MNSNRWSLVLVSLTALLLATARAQEPNAPATEENPQPVNTRPEINRGWSVQLAGNPLTFVDVSHSLVSTNGLGIDVASPEPALRAQLALEENAGLVVTGVPAESIGAKAGLKVHDVLVQLNGANVGDVARLGELLESSDGKAVKLRVLRGGKIVEIEATPKKPVLARLRLTQVLDHINQKVTYEDRYRLGVTLAEADETLRAHLRLAAGEGLVVTEVIPDGAAAEAGIQSHDVLTVLDAKRLTTVDAINAQVQKIKDKGVELRLLRGGKEMTFQIVPRKTHEAAFTDQPLTYWDTKTCNRCHGSTWQPHVGMARRLGAPTSVWTDGHSTMLFPQRLDGITNGAPQSGTTRAAPQQQIEALKSQLAEMQKTLTALEASLAPAEPQANDKE